MLALAVLGCDLKALKCDWLSTLLNLQTLANVRISVGNHPWLNSLCVSTQVRAGELSLCYEAVAAEYPAIMARYPLYLPPRKPPRRGVMVALLAQDENMKVVGNEEEEQEEEEREEGNEEAKLEREETTSGCEH